MADRPHIIIFNPDQWRGDVLGHMGNPGAVTPNLDRMVQEDSVSFSSAFCQNPVCTPSRCSFMTGWYPHVRGHRTMHHMLRQDEPMLLRRLKEAGYFVWWGVARDTIPADADFSLYCDARFVPGELRIASPAVPDDWRGEPQSDSFYSFYLGKLPTGKGEVHYDIDWAVVEEAISQIRNAPVDQPICIYLELYRPHPPYAVEDPWYSAIDRSLLPPRIPVPEDWTQKCSMMKGIYERQGLQRWTEDRWDELRATFYGSCARVDHQLGMVLEALRNTGIYDDTAVFFFSDHGDYTGDYGLVEKAQNSFEDCLSRVPLVIKPPSSFPVEPGVRDALVELLDFTATVEEFADLEHTYDHFGSSLTPVLSGETDEHRDAVFCEGGRRLGEKHCMELESNIEGEQSLYWPRLSLQYEEGPAHTKAVMCRTRQFKYVRRLYERDEFYDLRRDPCELDNRIDDPAYSAPVAELKDRLLSFYLETGDTVPHGTDLR